MAHGIPPFDVATSRQGNTLFVTPTGELDVSTADRVRTAMAERAPDERLVLDLRQLAFVDTSGLQLVVEASRASRDQGWEFVVVRGARAVQRVFEIAGLDAVLPFTDDAPGDGPPPAA